MTLVGAARCVPPANGFGLEPRVCRMMYRTTSGVAIGAAETLIQTLLESPDSVAWKSHWLISTLDSGVSYESYANEIRTAGGGRGEVRVVSCGVLADPTAAAAVRGSKFQLSWYSELYLFTDSPKHLPQRLNPHTTDSTDFEDAEFDDEVLRTLDELGAYAYLADGDWLNFATRSEALLAEIAAAEKLSKERGW